MVFLCYIFIVIVFDIVVTFYTLFNIENDSLLVVKKIFSAFFYFMRFASLVAVIIIIFMVQFHIFFVLFAPLFTAPEKKTKIKRILLWKVWDEKKWERKVKGWMKKKNLLWAIQKTLYARFCGRE